MSALRIKLWRELGRLWAQVAAIALVMAAGVATLIIGVGTYDSLSRTRASYYEANRFADIFASVARAPRSLIAEIAQIDGVRVAEARIDRLAMADIDGLNVPASVQLVSLPDIGEPALNRLYLRTGRPPEMGTSEAVVSEAFAKANGFVPGSRFRVLINGALRTIVVSGIALSPEFVYAMAPGEIMPDEHRFGIVWMPEKELAAAYDLSGAFSTVSVKLLNGTSEQAVIEELDRLLAPYGGQGAYGRDRQTSHAYLDAELQQLRSMSQVLPPIFLLVAAFLVNITLSRLIALEREQIGLMKALGYSSWAIARHYVEFVLVIALFGIVLGFVLGYWLGNELTRVYAQFYTFPLLIFSREPSTYAIAAAITVGASVFGALNAVRKAAWLPPAIAMLPPSPPKYKRLLGDGFNIRLPVRQTAIMATRHLMRWPWRTAGGVLGIAFSVAILVGSLWSVGAVEYMVDVTFNRTERQDASINFTGSKRITALYGVERLPVVLKAEPYRNVGVEISFGHRSRRVAIAGREADADLSRLLDLEENVVRIPDSGLVLSRALADILGVGPGSKVHVKLLEGDRREFDVPVSTIVEGYLGLSAYMELDALNRLIGQDRLISGVNIRVDPLEQDALFGMLKQTPSAGFIALQSVALQQFRATLAQSLFIMVGVLFGLAGLIAFGVVYNFSRISLSEQGREMASLRVLGFTRGEVSALLLAEIAAVTLIAQPLGWFIGYIVALGMTEGFSTEIFQMPLVVGLDVYALSSIAVIAAAILSGLVVRRRIDRLDMIAVLKTRE